MLPCHFGFTKAPHDPAAVMTFPPTPACTKWTSSKHTDCLRLIWKCRLLPATTNTLQAARLNVQMLLSSRAQLQKELVTTVAEACSDSPGALEQLNNLSCNAHNVQAALGFSFDLQHS